MDFARFCKGIYDFIDGVSLQDDFVIQVFKAAGSTYSFSTKKVYSNSNYAGKLYNGSKPLSGNHRGSFPNPIDIDGLAKYFSEHIKKESVRNVMNYFTIPTDSEINMTALSRALADQLQIIIHEPDRSDDVIAANYQQYLNEPVEEKWSPHKSLYESDSFWVENTIPGRKHTVDFYETFTHTWKILNSGKVAWKGRKLICTNLHDIVPTTLITSVDIPETLPGERATVFAEFDARGTENVFVSSWTMVNSEGKDCFPEASGPLSVTINVENRSFKAKETGGK